MKTKQNKFTTAELKAIAQQQRVKAKLYHDLGKAFYTAMATVILVQQSDGKIQNITRANHIRFLR